VKDTLHSRLTAFALLVVVALAVVSGRAQTGHAACAHVHARCAASSHPAVK